MAGLRQLMRQMKHAKTQEERDEIEDQILDFHEDQQRKANEAYAELIRLRSLNTPGVGVGVGTPGWTPSAKGNIAGFFQMLADAAKQWPG